MIQKLLVANRGEVAARIARACDALGITPVFAVSEADRAALLREASTTLKVVMRPVCAAPSRISPR